jgi:hypothetical protein
MNVYEPFTESHGSLPAMEPERLAQDDRIAGSDDTRPWDSANRSFLSYGGYETHRRNRSVVAAESDAAGSFGDYRQAYGSDTESPEAIPAPAAASEMCGPVAPHLAPA